MSVRAVQGLDALRTPRIINPASPVPVPVIHRPPRLRRLPPPQVLRRIPQSMQIDEQPLRIRIIGQGNETVLAESLWHICRPLEQPGRVLEWLRQWASLVVLHFAFLFRHRSSLGFVCRLSGLCVEDDFVPPVVSFRVPGSKNSLGPIFLLIFHAPQFRDNRFRLMAESYGACEIDIFKFPIPQIELLHPLVETHGGVVRLVIAIGLRSIWSRLLRWYRCFQPGILINPGRNRCDHTCGDGISLSQRPVVGGQLDTAFA